MAFRDNLRFVQLDEENFELKFKDFNVTTPVANYSAQSIVSAVTQGVGESQRIGEEIFVHRVEARGYISAASGLFLGNAYPQFFPMSQAKVCAMVILDTMPGTAGVAPTAADMFDNYPTGGVYPYAPRNPVFNRLKVSGRFKCLARHEGALDQVFNPNGMIFDVPSHSADPSASSSIVLDQNVGAESGDITWPSYETVGYVVPVSGIDFIPNRDLFTISVEFKPPISVEYSDANVCKNHLYLVIIGEPHDPASGPTDLTFAQYAMSVYYTDDAALPQLIAPLEDVPPVNGVGGDEFAEDEAVYGFEEPPLVPEVQRSGQSKRSRYNSYFEPTPSKRGSSSGKKRDREASKRYGRSTRTRFSLE